MIKFLFPILLVVFVLFGSLVSAQGASFRRMSMADAAEMMKTNPDHILLDVRTGAEFSSGHIPGAINLPLQDIVNGDTEPLPDLNQLILVYCRSGNRSMQASGILSEYGYTNIIEIGGIYQWSGDIVSGAA